QLSSPHLRRAVLSALDHGGQDLEAVRKNVEDWFDGAMDRAAGWYKRRTQAVLFAIGLLCALLLNVDALHVMNRMNVDKKLRDAVVAQAAQVQAPDAAASGPPGERIERLRTQLEATGMPIGWNYREATWLPVPVQLCGSAAATDSPCDSPDLGKLVRAVFGWLLTALAVMLGAPFWFDVLNKLMVIRSTVKPKEKSPEEASEDRQRTVATGRRDAPTGDKPAPPAPARPGPAPVPVAPPAPAQFEPHEWRSGYTNAKEVKL
ncbi:MAG: hypothetical protein ACK4PH_01740, partial [Aquincola tertiaricarbonis]